MPESQRQRGNSQTLCIELNELDFVAVEQCGGRATVIRFRVHNTDVKMGDVLLVLSGPDIRFHGMISGLDPEGWAVASDPEGSTIPASAS